jgi:hypothetical protein
MGDDDISNVKDVIDATTGLLKAVPVYEDLVQPAAKELGTALETVAKTVNLALAPISGVIWSYETIKEFVSTSVSKKLQSVPKEDIVTPNPVVAGPALEALKYSGHEETLREMYANLLANALDINTANNAHPSFVELIKQLSPPEAKLLLFISNREEYPHVCNIYERHEVRGGIFSWGDDGEITTNKVKEEFTNVCSEFDSNLDIGSALDNFRRLQILDIESSTTQKINDSWLGQDSDNMSERLELEIEHREKLFFSKFGMKFIETCVKNKTNKDYCDRYGRN